MWKKGRITIGAPAATATNNLYAMGVTKAPHLFRRNLQLQKIRRFIFAAVNKQIRLSCVTEVIKNFKINLLRVRLWEKTTQKKAKK
jgi:hypothetical protein